METQPLEQYLKPLYVSNCELRERLQQLHKQHWTVDEDEKCVLQITERSEESKVNNDNLYERWRNSSALNKSIASGEAERVQERGKKIKMKVERWSAVERKLPK